MKRTTLTVLVMAAAFCASAQALKEKKGVRLYEHHSSSINGGAAFGSKANGSMSGYDFVKHEYHGSFNPANMGKWPAADAANIDMVEHNGPFGNGGGFGITSATSTIWAGDIIGNGLTTLHPAPASFNYDTSTVVNTLKLAHPILGGNTINALVAGKVYISRVRSTEMYVAIKVTKVNGLPPGYKNGDTTSMYFDFDYKYGTVGQGGGTSVQHVAADAASFSVFPNPSQGNFSIANMPAQLQWHKAIVQITDLMGKTAYVQPVATGNFNLQLSPGMYTITLTDGSYTGRQKLVITE